MKQRLLTLLLAIPSFTTVLATRYERRFWEDWGLPSGKEATESLAFGIPILIVGLLLVFLDDKTKTPDEKKAGKGSSKVGCFGLLLVFIAAIILLPILLWGEAIFVSIINVLVVLALVILVIVKVHDWLK